MRLSPFHAAALMTILSTGSVSAHDWYSDLKGPEGQSCCNQGDCHHVGHRYSPAGGHEIQINDQWVRVDPKIILPQASPDGLTHACFSQYWWIDPPTKVFLTVRCVILGGMA
jgi:hypothetical protein